MSAFGSIIDRLETHWRTADPTIPAGANGFERDVRLSDDLSPGQFPHVFAHDPTEATARLDFRQDERTTSIQFDYWTDNGATQEAVSLVLDAFQAAVAADPTLNSLVDDAFCSLRSVADFEAVGKKKRAAVVIVQTVKVV